MQDLPRNEMKGTMRDHVFQFTNTLGLSEGGILSLLAASVPILDAFDLVILYK